MGLGFLLGPITPRFPLVNRASSSLQNHLAAPEPLVYGKKKTPCLKVPLVYAPEPLVYGKKLHV